MRVRVVSVHAWTWLISFATLSMKPRERLLDCRYSVPMNAQFLWVDEVLPETDHDSGSVRARALIRAISSQNATVTVLATNHRDPRPLSYLDDLTREGICVIANRNRRRGTYVGLAWHEIARRSWRMSGVRVGCLFSHVVISRRGSFRATVSPRVTSKHYKKSLVLTRCPEAEIIFDTVDLHFLREARENSLRGGVIDEGVAPEVMSAASEECKIALSSNLVWTVSELERSLLSLALAKFVEKDGNATMPRIEIVSNVVERSAQHSTFDFEERENFVFIGSLNHAPNIDALKWLANDIWPTFLELESASEYYNSTHRPSLLIVGSDWNGRTSITREIFGSRNSRVHVLGHVKDLTLDSLMARTRVSLAPLRYGAGVKGKVCLSAAMGVPVIGTEIAMEGLNIPAVLANSATKFAESMLYLYNDRVAWEELRELGLEEVENKHSPGHIRRVLSDLLRANST